MRFTLRTLTPLWTGGVDQTCDRLHETGLIGSLRWWYEALVRGLGGYACDPTDERSKCKEPKLGKKSICAVCYLFGTTGWARKFRLRVVDAHGQILQKALEKDVEFSLEFIELRPLDLEEKWLLTKAIEIAAKYGALGGKTTLKPQKGPVGKDFGLLRFIAGPDIQNSADIQNFLQNFKLDKTLSRYPNLANFFFISGAFLSRLQMNPLLGLDKDGQRLPKLDETQTFLQGKRGSTNQDAVSKKIFSFQADGGRIWGYARDAQMRNEIVAQIKSTLGVGNYIAKTGEEVLHEL